MVNKVEIEVRKSKGNYLAWLGTRSAMMSEMTDQISDIRIILYSRLGFCILIS